MIPGRVGKILSRACAPYFGCEQQTLALLEWACAEGHTPDDWGVTLASTSYKTVPAVLKRVLQLGAEPNLTNDNE